MKGLLTPAAILILAITQVPGMIKDINFNQCVSSVDDPYEDNAQRNNAYGNRFCNGGS
jgi:hypothetical protein